MFTPASILKETFGYDTFRPFQREVIENVLARRDTLAVMPTGGGKSLCYQIPALLFDGLTVVVSPLISLMKDQVEQLRAFGVSALFLNSSLSSWEYQENMELVKKGEVKLLYVAPETLLTPRIISLLTSVQVDLFTIDEAHCISEWGHDFRPDYRQLVDVRQLFPKAACLALTATATQRVRQDIHTTLGFTTNNEFLASFNRENLYIEVVHKSDPVAQTIEILQRFKDQSGIIYCFSRRQVDDLAGYLASRGYSVRPYHAGLDDIDRRKNQEAFIRDDVQIIVATIAFGMGINKPNVRFVIHFNLPKSIENYYQEIGRAGRDGLPAHCTLLYSYADVAKINYFIDQKEGNEKRMAIEHLDAIVRFAEDETNCHRKSLLNYFGESEAPDECGYCDNCTNEGSAVEETDITILAQKFLLCVRRTGEKFGAGHIADVLLGSKNVKVLRWEHNQLSTYGIGTELTRKQWMLFSRQLLAKGYLKQAGEYRTLSLTPSAIEVLMQRQRVMGVVHEPDRVMKDARKNEAVKFDQALFTLLRQKRKEMADTADVPPYVIFSDRTLIEMAAYFPQTPDHILNIFGVGQVKAQRYGDAFLLLIRDYCKKHGLKPGFSINNSQTKAGVSSLKSGRGSIKEVDLGSRTILVAEAYNHGESLPELMERHQVKAGTILDHLMRYVNAGNELRNGEDLRELVEASPEQQQAAFIAFDELGTTTLKPVFDKIDGQLDYEALKLLRLVYLISHQD